ncbi:MAG: hypothetical protein PUB21_07830 [Bacteroidales bacterium]|nr:hypothetical protein [Bacteroidales bacterium]
MNALFTESEMTKDVIVYRQGNTLICVEDNMESPFPYWVQSKKEAENYLNENYAPFMFNVKFVK